VFTKNLHFREQPKSLNYMDIIGFGQSDGFGYATLEWTENMKFELSNINQRSIKSTCKGFFYNYFYCIYLG
jgi:hypothetical protein